MLNSLSPVYSEVMHSVISNAPYDYRGLQWCISMLKSCCYSLTEEDFRYYYSELLDMIIDVCYDKSHAAKRYFQHQLWSVRNFYKFNVLHNILHSPSNRHYFAQSSAEDSVKAILFYLAALHRMVPIGTYQNTHQYTMRHTYVLMYIGTGR